MAIICCYYGKLPPMFSYWLDSCRRNPEFTFFVVTDIAEGSIDAAENVIKLNYSLEALKQRAESVLDFPVSLNTPYKICDFRPSFGRIFANELREYDFWGHCDIDMIFGNMSSFITDDVLDKHDKIYSYGHLTLYRNCERINNLYKEKGSAFSYKTVYSKPEYFSFDEYLGMPSICKKQGIAVYNKEECADITLSRNSRLYMSRRENHSYQIFARINNGIFQLYVDESGKLQKAEMAYIHFKNRRFSYEAAANDDYIITSDRIIPYSDYAPVSEKMVIDLSGYNACNEKKELRQYYFGRIKSFLKMSPAQKLVYFRQRLYWEKI